MKILVFGSGGQLGRELTLMAPADVELVGIEHGECDISKRDQVAALVRRNAPDVIINCAAYTNVDRAESEADMAHSVNALGPANIAAAALVTGKSRVVHVSTDYVFDGQSSRPYCPDDACAPLSVYGRSKLEGETEVLGRLQGRGVVVRTSWVYSRFGRNFVKTVLRLISDRNEISIVADQVGSPTWAGSLAAAIWKLVRVPGVSGVMHWTDAGVASWFDFAVAIQEEAHSIGLVQQPKAIVPIASSQYPVAAKRPQYSVLDSSESWRILGEKPRHWRESLRLMLSDMAEKS